MQFNQNFHTYYYEKKLHFNTLIFHGDTKGKTELLENAV